MRPKLVSDEEVVQKAREIFIARGPQASTEAIAKALGISQAAIFKRFRTKKKLLLAVISPGEMPEWIGDLKKGPDDRPFMVQLKEILSSIQVFSKIVTPLINLIHYSGISPREMLTSKKESPPIQAMRELTLWLQRSHKKGLIRKVDFSTAAMCILGFMHASMMLNLITEGKGAQIQPQQYVNDAAKILCSGLLEEK